MPGSFKIMQRKSGVDFKVEHIKDDEWAFASTVCDRDTAFKKAMSRWMPDYRGMCFDSFPVELVGDDEAVVCDNSNTLLKEMARFFTHIQS